MLVGAGIALGASAFVPTVARNGVCAFVPCDPGPQDAAIGVAADGRTPVVAISPCAAGLVRNVTVTTTDAAQRVLWSAERVGPGHDEVIRLDAPPPYLRVTAPLESGRPPGSVVIDVTYPRGTARGSGSLDGIAPGRFSLFGLGGRSLASFRSQARQGEVCVWYEPEIDRVWPPLATTTAVVFLGTALAWRRWSVAQFKRDAVRVFGADT